MDILRRHRIVAVRFPSKEMPGIPQGMYVRRPAGYDLGAVSRKQRGHVLRGLEACEIRDVDPDELLAVGIELNRDTLARQSRQDPELVEPARWKLFVDAVCNSPGMSVRGAYVNGRLASYLIFCKDSGWLHLMFKMSRSADLAHYPNHALDYSILSGAASDPTIECVSNGFTSLLPNQGLDQYKRQLGYEIEPHNLCIHFHPLLTPALTSRLSVSLCVAAHSLLPGWRLAARCCKVVEGANISMKMSDPPVFRQTRPVKSSQLESD